MTRIMLLALLRQGNNLARHQSLAATDEERTVRIWY